MRRIFADLFRQTRWITLFLLVAFTIGGLVLVGRTAPGHLERVLNFASLGVDLLAFAMATTGTDALRMMRWVFILPVRRKDFGAGLWFANVIVPASLTVGAKILVLGLSTFMWPHTVTLRWVVSSGIFDLAFAGSLAWFLLQAVKDEGRANRFPWLQLPFWTIATLAFLAGALTLAWYMPTSAMPWGWPIGGVLAGMLALTAIGYRQSERFAVDGGGLGLIVFGMSRNTGAPHVPAVRMAFDSRLSGPRRMLWQQFRSAALVQLLIMSLLSVMGALPLSKQQGLIEQFGAVWSDTDLRPMLWVLGWMVSFNIGMKRWDASRILVMRGLPMSAREINQLLLLRPVVTWLAMWFVAVPFFSLPAATGYAWLGLGTLAGMMGLSGVTGIAVLRWHRLALLKTYVLMAVNYLLIFGHPWKLIHTGVFGTTVGQLALLALGIAGLTVTYRWQAAFLTRSSALYRRAF